MTQSFTDRTEAGERLAGRVAALGLADPVILALPRGGVPVAIETARTLRAPLDLLLVRKIGCPGQEELAAGAVVDGPVHEVVFNSGILSALGMSEADFAPAIREKLNEIEARRARYLEGRLPVPIAGRDAVVVDDGIATGATMKAALRALKRKGPASITLAVPVAPEDTLDEIRPLVDQVVCLEMPDPFIAVGAHYLRFEQTSDAEVVALMREAAAWRPEQDEGRTNDA